MQKILTRDRDYYRDLIHLAIPVALQNLITFAVNCTGRYRNVLW